jgi:hypothetical protein
MSRLSRRGWTWILAFAVVMLSVLSFVILTATRTKITASNGYKIRSGMTLEEVEAILGGPPRVEGDCARARIANNKFWDGTGCTREGRYYSEDGSVGRDWYSDEASIWVTFQGERVTVWAIEESRGLLGRIEAWLRSLLE